MEIIFRPITVWPGTRTQHAHSSKFKAGYSDTLRLLDRELRHLRATNIVIQLALRESDIRLDGLPRSDARPMHSGVILSFDSKHGPLSYPCDTFSSWQDNVRAIALALEHLRTVDRYGVTKRGEQYTGWKSLPAPNGKMDKSMAVKILQRYMTDIIDGAELAAVAYRAAVMKEHPDRGGDVEQFKLIQEAKEVLDL